LPDFSGNIIPKLENIHQMSTKCTKQPYDIPNSCQIFQMAIK
jgi:hypothetical protein